jgi:lipid-A-disaccharide synthase-like uncharacterized protein
VSKAAQFGVTGAVWEIIGYTGALVFYGRFYVQWIASELAKRSVVPVIFWYMSSLGSVALLAYGVHIGSPLGTLSQAFNIIVYARNLVHIWRERGRLSKRRNLLTHGAVAAIVAVAVFLTLQTWLREYEITQSVSMAEARETWFWLAVGLAGQALFGIRFLIQWIATERRRKSVVPPIFWHISIVAAALQASSFAQRREWVYALGLAATLVIYGRNLWLIRRSTNGPTGMT